MVCGNAALKAALYVFCFSNVITKNDCTTLFLEIQHINLKKYKKAAPTNVSAENLQ